MKESAIWIMLGGVIGCSDAQPPPATLIVDVLGSRTALESFEVRVEPLVADADLIFRSPFLVRRFTSHAPLEAATRLPLTLTAIANGVAASQISWTPFVCRLGETFSDKIAAGWRGEEVLEAYLPNDGMLSLESDFGRHLAHVCNWYAPGGGAGEGFATLNRSPSLCNESDRTNTALEVADVSDPARPISLVSQVCMALHARPIVMDPVFPGMISTEILLTGDPDGAVTLALNHCWSSAETYPVTVTPASLSQEACGSAVVVVQSSPTAPPVETKADGGMWLLTNGPQLLGGGHLLAEIDMTFSESPPGRHRFMAKGHVDLPIVRTDVGRLR
jgi:hypothetical protein